MSPDNGGRIQYGVPKSAILCRADKGASYASGVSAIAGAASGGNADAFSTLPCRRILVTKLQLAKTCQHDPSSHHNPFGQLELALAPPLDAGASGDDDPTLERRIDANVNSVWCPQICTGRTGRCKRFHETNDECHLVIVPTAET